MSYDTYPRIATYPEIHGPTVRAYENTCRVLVQDVFNLPYESYPLDDSTTLAELCTGLEEHQLRSLVGRGQHMLGKDITPLLELRMDELLPYLAGHLH
ncbi:MAG: hypothetical protein ABIH41_02765 [Nanoarchaeota archaeon]